MTTTGDRLVGEIKRVEKDVMSTSKPATPMPISRSSGKRSRRFKAIGCSWWRRSTAGRVSGSLKPDPEKKPVVQIAETSAQLPQVAAMQPIERAFGLRFAGGLDFGYSLTRANSATQISLGTNLTYRDEHHVDVVLANVFRSSQENAPDTQRWDLGNDFRRFLGTRWYVNTTQDFLNSEEQGMDLRATIGGGGGRYLIRSSSQYLAVGGGLAWTNENYTDPALPTKDSAEAYLGTEFMTEKLKITDLITRFLYYPSLTISGR